MNTKKLAFVFSSLFVLLLTCVPLYATDAPLLRKIQHSVLSPTTEQVVLQFNGSYSPKIFTLKGEMPRVVFDFADMTHSREIKNITTQGTLVKHIRVGMHKDNAPKTRVVFDLANSGEVTFHPQFDAENSLMVILFSSAKEATPEGNAPEQATIEHKPAAKKPLPVPPPAIPSVKPEQTIKPAPPAEPAKDTKATPKGPTPPKVATGMTEVLAPNNTASNVAETTSKDAQLKAITFDSSSVQGEMVLFQLNGFHPPIVHGTTEGNPKVICEFNKTKLLNGIKPLINTSGNFVKGIRTSTTKKPEKIRVIIELAPNRGYDLQQTFFREDNTFAITVNLAKK
jgi:hypothetical protein